MRPQVPAWGGSLVELLITPAVTVQGAGLCGTILKSRIAEDLSGGAAREIVSEMVVVWEIPPPLAFTVIVDVPTVSRAAGTEGQRRTAGTRSSD